MWVRNGMTLGTKWYDLGTKWYGRGYEMVWDESAWVRNDLIPNITLLVLLLGLIIEFLSTFLVYMYGKC